MSKPLAATEGYLMIDNRAEGSIPPGSRSALEEYAVYTCSHCQSMVVKHPQRQRERVVCTGCGKVICDACGALRAQGAKCVTFNQIIAEVQERAVRGLPPDPDIMKPRF